MRSWPWRSARGIVDHAAGSSIHHNIRILQSRGWVMSTLTETRNRADLLIVLGTTLRDTNPGFWSRIGSPAEAMFLAADETRTVVLIGDGLDATEVAGARIGDVVTLQCPDDRIGDVLGALRARLKGAQIAERELAGVTLAGIDGLAARIAKARYGVIAWAPGALPAATADLTIERATELIKDLSRAQRFAGLALGGAEGATTAVGVCTWQSGYPLRVSYESGAPDYDPDRNAIDRCLAEGEGDLLIWTASISPDIVPPATTLPLIVLGTPGLALDRPADVFIPVGTPGLDHKGRMIRVDGVVSLPLKAVTNAGLPRVADVAAAIKAAL
ncbi:MAG: formylmethanofuran dehydrogenase [Hyphomicrobiaceae bacterium]|nr:formylmethanofuran dehydrogenase [Hyphomicrobiaceae bacterium]